MLAVPCGAGSPAAASSSRTIWGSVLPSNRTRSKRRAVAHFLGQGGGDGAPARAGGEQDRAVDVEEDQAGVIRGSPSAPIAPHRHEPLAQRRRAPGCPGDHGSRTTPPQATVECTSVSLGRRRRRG